MVMTIETEMLVVWTAQQVVAAWTQYESMKQCWLWKVSMCTKLEDCKVTTYQCRPGHPPNAQSICTETLDIEGDAEESNLYLQKSAKC